MAIARDLTSGATPANNTSYTMSHTCTGSNLFLTVWVMVGNTTDVVTGVTYGGVAMRRTLARQNTNASTGWLYCYTLHNPPTGANNVVVSGSTTLTSGVLYATSYTGVAQSDIPDSTNTGTSTGGTSFTLSTTVVSSNCWLLAGTQDNSGNSTAGTGTSRTSPLSAGFGQQCWDSNGTVGTGSQPLHFSNTIGGTKWDGLIISIAPFVASVNSGIPQQAKIIHVL